jgi:NADPH-dependent 2,4-dienoyl-CoA reductase/sulfur reductase-like enzyme
VTDESTFVIVGASLAGVSAAEELRKQGFGGAIILIGAEAHHPYIRPPLSKEYLAGSGNLDDVYVHPLEWYDENDIDLRLGTVVVEIDRGGREVVLADGARVGYSKMLIATGQSPKALEVPGASLPGVHLLRTLEDSQSLAGELTDGGKRVIVIGSGWIGMEVAATAKTLGNDVRVLLNSDVPLRKPLGAELGKFFEDVQKAHDVVFAAGTTVEEIVPGKDGAVAGVRTGSNQVFPAEVIVVAIGAAPNVELAITSGLEVGDGILVDATLVTSDPDIYAAGDVASELHPVLGDRMRSEHWSNALNQGAAAARSMLGQEVSYDEVPYVYSDQFEIGMEFAGYPPLIQGATLVYRGSKESKEFIVFWLVEGRVIAGMNVNVWDVSDDIKGVIQRANVVDQDALANPDVPLAGL